VCPTDIKEGKIVPVEITVKLLLAAMRKSDKTQFLIDGFPRSMNNYDGWCTVVGDQADVAFCLVYACGEAELERRSLFPRFGCYSYCLSLARLLPHTIWFAELAGRGSEGAVTRASLMSLISRDTDDVGRVYCSNTDEG
jgi:hypothetical protein